MTARGGARLATVLAAAWLAAAPGCGTPGAGPGRSTACEGRPGPCSTGALWREQLDAARAARARGDLAAAEDAYREAAQLAESPAVGPTSRCDTLAELAALYEETGRRREATDALERATTLAAPASPLAAWSTVAALHELARLRHEDGDASGARAAYDQALARGERFLQAFPEEPTARQSLERTAEAYAALLASEGDAEALEALRARVARSLPPPAGAR